MTEQFAIFQSFNDGDLAQEVAERLRRADIPLRIEDTSSPIAPVIGGSSLAADISIRLRPQDFQKAHAVLEDYYSTQLDSVEEDYYLFQFTDEELEEIIKKPDEWGPLDYKLAQKILKDRGKEIKVEEIEAIKTERIQEISKSEQIGKSWVFWGYFIAVFFGPIGIFYGLTVTNSKKTLPNGQRVYAYNGNSRRHSKNILIISSVLTTILVLLKVLSATKD